MRGNHFLDQVISFGIVDRETHFDFIDLKLARTISWRLLGVEHHACSTANIVLQVLTQSPNELHSLTLQPHRIRLAIGWSHRRYDVVAIDKQKQRHAGIVAYAPARHVA